jgi:aerobic carbon-monoxide dehydrogenase medium subunit
MASFGSGTLSITGSAAGTLIVIIGDHVTRRFAPRLRVNGRNQAGCGYEGGRTVKPPPLRYSRPGSTAEALELLASLGEDGKVLAGGQSLVPLLSMRLAAPEHLVDINRLAEFGYVRVEDGQVRVGALARHAEVLADPAAATAPPLLAKALRFVAHAAIRNRGTTVGSIVHADPAGEMPAVLAVLDGAVRVAYQGGERLVRASEFFLGPLESAVQPGELATEALFPVLPPAAGTGFAEVSRRRGDYAVCGVAAIVRLDEEGRITQARAGYLSVGPSPLVLDLTYAAAADQAAAGPAPAKAAAADPAVAAARTLAAAARTAADPATDGAADPAGHASPVGPPGFPAAADLARQQLDPEPDIHATSDYRRHLAGVLTQRALLEALAEAQVRGTAREGAGKGSPGGTAPGGMTGD